MSKLLLGTLTVGIIAVLSAFILKNEEMPSRIEPTGGGRVSVSVPRIDFGNIEQSKGPVSATVEIRNDGDGALEIYRVSTSCGCTTADMDQSPIASGASRPLIIQFDPLVHPDESGPITRVVYLQSSDPEKPEVEIEIVGNVIPKL
ncbi:TPA: hypothetical protein DDZ10_02120 [Candidatus Uhrbacteria bacterium]|nr:MAG: hypothetical protein UY79_C0003G0069 [Parcubacteria group bacterium GW2011_GWA2_53_21]OGL72163.1 MAG: hypothetical protein A3D69_01315 [Candidatus Uhrbacteria bacterium RIFCSPHIGHO2_02_FULL_54_11]HBL39445.1 hypothetical protein [Candidatus Uhrbacteria bacterium]